MNKSIRAFGVFMMVLFVALVVQLANLQMIQAHRLNADPRNTRQVVADFGRARGAILSADGVTLAQSVPSNDSFRYQRVYPQGQLFDFLTGYLSFRYGAEGVESSYASALAGRGLPVHVSDLGKLLGGSQIVGNVTLTVSAALQRAAAAALGQRVGAVVALDPRNGSILALVSQPGYDPNEMATHSSSAAQAAFTSLNADPGRPLLPRVFRESYAPGSTFKTVTASALLDHAPQLATKAYPVSSSLTLPLTTNVLHNFGGESCGGVLPDLFRVSCDTGFGAIGLDLGPASLSGEASAFGFNSPPPLDVPGVFRSTFPPASFFDQRTPLLAFSAIGQDDVSATPLQMALVASAIADNGVIMTPHVMKEIRSSDGTLISSFAAHPWRTATSPSTAFAIRGFMESVVTSGTGTAVAIPGVSIAAKTGTAEVDATHTNAWMIAFAPAEAPTIAIAAVLPGLTGVGNEVTGGVRAAPIVRALLAAYLGKG